MQSKATVSHSCYATFIWTAEYGVSQSIIGELHSIDFTIDEHHLWMGDFLSGSIFTTCEQNGGKWTSVAK